MMDLDFMVHLRASIQKYRSRDSTRPIGCLPKERFQKLLQVFVASGCGELEHDFLREKSIQNRLEALVFNATSEGPTAHDPCVYGHCCFAGLTGKHGNNAERAVLVPIACVHCEGIRRRETVVPFRFIVSSSV